MLEKIDTQGAEFQAFEAKGKVTAQDYNEKLLPLLNEARSEGRKIRVLFYFGPEFEGYTAGASWEDFKLGLHHTRTFERIAIVTDLAWMKNLTKVFGAMIPCAVRSFPDSELEDAKKWIDSGDIGLNHSLDRQKGVVKVDLSGPLTSIAIERLTHTVDEWLMENGELKGLAIHTKEFPGWENLGSFFSHMEFVRNHHRKIRRVALSADGEIPAIMEKLASHFVEAEVKRFDFDQFDEAVQWASDPK